MLERIVIAIFAWVILGYLGVFPGMSLLSVVVFSSVMTGISVAHGLATIKPSKLPELQEWHDTYDDAINAGCDPAIAVEKADKVEIDHPAFGTIKPLMKPVSDEMQSNWSCPQCERTSVLY